MNMTKKTESGKNDSQKTQKPVACIILAAGMGTRMKSNLPKVLHQVAAKPMLRHILDSAAEIGAVKTIVVVGPDTPEVAAVAAPSITVIQEDRLGTAHAVLAARDALEGFDGDILVLFGDTPLITAQSLKLLLDKRCSCPDSPVVIFGMRPVAGFGSGVLEYGRLVQDDKGKLTSIIEYADADEKTRAIELCNGGIMALDGQKAMNLIAAIGNNNVKGEYYLTDIVTMAQKEGLSCEVVEGDAEDVLGVNSRAELAQIEALMQNRLRQKAMAAGVTMTAPETVYLCVDTVLGQDVIIGPHVVFGEGVTIADNVEIKAFSHIEGTIIGKGASIGPYARLRPGTELGEDCRVGNFVETKKAIVENGAKISHLSYIGDAFIGAEANIGAGTITCNYDGFMKHHTHIGKGAFIGSNSALVAPVHIGDGAVVGAGSAITHDIAKGALGVTRADQREITDFGDLYRARKQTEKEALAAKTKRQIEET